MAIVRNQQREETNEVILISSSDEESTPEKNSSNSAVKLLFDNQTCNNLKAKEEVTADYPQILNSFTLKKSELICSISSKDAEETQCKINSNVQGDRAFLKNADSSNVPETSSSSNQCNTPRTSGNNKTSFTKYEISQFAHSRFRKFLELCKCSMNDIGEREREKIVNKLIKCYNIANPLFKYSKNFHSYIEKKIEHVVKDYKNIYVHIGEVYTELKGFSRKMSKNSSESSIPKNDISAKIDENNISKENDSTVNSIENNLLQSNDKVKEGRTDEHCVDNTIQTLEQKPSKKHIKRLELLLRRIHRKIRSLQQKDMSLDDLNDQDSLYIQEARFKRRFMKVWEKLCLLTGRTKKTGRQTERRFFFNGSRYPEINIKVEKFINKKKLFPDYNDILNIVMSVNAILKFSNNQAQLVAREIFEDVGKLLQKRRLQDNRELMGCFLTDDVNLDKDPAYDNDYLKSQLEESSKIASKNLDELMESYVIKQAEEKLEPEEVDDNADLSPLHSDKHDDDEEDEAEEEEPELSDIDLIEDMLNNDEESSKNVIETVPEETTTKNHILSNSNDDGSQKLLADPQLPSTSSSYDKEICKSDTESFQLKRKYKSAYTDSSNKKVCLNNGENRPKYEEIIILE